MCKLLRGAVRACLLEAMASIGKGLKELYNSDTGGDLKNYEGVAILSEVQRILDKSDAMREPMKHVLDQIKSEIPTGREGDPNYGCLIVLTVPLCLSLLSIRNSLALPSPTWSDVAMSSAVMFGASALLVGGNVVAVVAVVTAGRKKSQYEHEFYSYLAEKKS